MRSNDSNPWWHQGHFMFVGRIIEQKGISYIIDQWASLVEEYQIGCPHLLVVGGIPSEISEIRKKLDPTWRIGTLEKENKLQWWGYLDSAGISTLLLRALCLISHSRYEPGGRVVLEAMAEGVPVISTPHGFARDLIEDWVNGFLVDFGDAQGLRKRMEHFIQQPLLRYSLGVKARETVTNALGRWRFLERHCEVYESIEASTALVLPPSRDRNNSVLEASKCITGTDGICPPIPGKESISTFIERSVGIKLERIDPIKLPSRHSVLYKVEIDGCQWAVRFPCGKITLRPIWLRDRFESYAITAGLRFLREVFASKLPSFVDLKGADAEHLLLLRPFLMRPRRSSVNLSAIVTNLRKLQSTPFPFTEPIVDVFDCNWRTQSRKEIEKRIAEFRRIISEQKDRLSTYRYPSLRFAWEKLRIDHTLGKVPSVQSVLPDLYQLIDCCADVSKIEADRLPILCHGDLSLSNCLLVSSKEVRFIDGEALHIGWYGQDRATLLSDLIREDDALIAESGQWKTLLTQLAQEKDEQALVLCWAIFQAIEELFKHLAMHLRTSNHQLEYRIRVLYRALRRLL